MSDTSGSPQPEPLDLLDYMRAIGHDVGAPIRHIRGFSGLLDDEIGASLEDEPRLLLDQIKSSAELAESMIYGLHDLAHLGGRLQRRAIPSLAAVVENAKDQLAAPELVVTIAGDAQANSDQRLLSRMIANIMRNTLAYANKPHLAVAIEQSSAGATITLRDQGPAFAQKEWLKLLQPFKRLHGRPTINAVGLGLTEVQHVAGLLSITLTAQAIPDKSLSIELRLTPG
ncbi:MAG: ATP-binding protein [Pseudomonadales bacterium]